MKSLIAKMRPKFDDSEYSAIKIVTGIYLEKIKDDKSAPDDVKKILESINNKIKNYQQ